MKWLPFGWAAGAEARLFCFPYAGGGSSMYFSWLNAFPRHLAACPVLLPGREAAMSVPPIDCLDVLLDRLVEVLRPLLDRPYALMGYSLGGRIAFGLAHRLIEAGLPAPLHLTVAACRDPLARPERPGVHRLPESEFIQHLRNLGGTPEEILSDRGLLELLLTMVRADFALIEGELPRTPLPCPITAYAGTDDRSAPPLAVGSWRDFTTSGFDLRCLSGSHFFIRQHSPTMIAGITRDLDHALGRVPVVQARQASWA
jgi:medium-chain acyl-[acyl-carrier-protein] hydrolase